MTRLAALTPFFYGAALLLFMAPVVGSAACAAKPALMEYKDAMGDSFVATPAGQEGAFLSNLAPDKAALYRYAMGHQDTLGYVPCYCGCVNQDHMSNASCYLKGPQGDGLTHFNLHAEG